MRSYLSDKQFAEYAANKQKQEFGKTFVLAVQYGCKKLGIPYADYNRLTGICSEYLETVNELNRLDSKRK